MVASAANNSRCTVGIAYNARIGGTFFILILIGFVDALTKEFVIFLHSTLCLGVRMLDGDMTDVVEAKSLSLRQHYIDIYSSSWGPEDDGRTLEGPGPLAKLALRNGILKVCLLKVCFCVSVCHIVEKKFLIIPIKSKPVNLFKGTKRPWFDLRVGIRKRGAKSGPLLL